jgi:hypothetical protein
VAALGLPAQERENQTRPAGTRTAAGVTWRAAAISFAVILISAPAMFYGEVVWYKGFWSNAVPASWPLAVLFLLTAAMGLPVLRRLQLTRPELLTIYCVVLVATPLLSLNVLFWALSQAISYYYFGAVFPEWETTFLHLIPPWFSPSSTAAVTNYFEGNATVPWSEWLAPLAAWSSLLIALFFANFCLLSLVQKQWIRHERLTFPLAQIPLETVQGEPGKRAHLQRNGMFWIGMAIALSAGVLSTLSLRLPALPSLSPRMTLMAAHVVGPLSALGRVDLLLQPWLLALAYIVPTEISFSVWFLWLARIGLTALSIAIGNEPGSAEDWWRFSFPAPYNQATGAVLVLALWALWGARRHLLRAVRIAFTWRGGGDDDEPLPYRWAMLGLIISFAWLVAFFLMAGCRPWFAIGFPAVIMGAYLSYARLQAEAALDTSFWWFNDVVQMPIGPTNLTPQELISLYTAGFVSAPMPSVVFSACSINSLTSFKIAESHGGNLRRLTYLLFFAFLFALLLGSFVALTGTYHLGFIETKGGTGNTLVANVLRVYGHDIYYDITYDVGPSPEGVFWIGVGGAVCIALGLLRLRLLWWPLHPVGYILSNSLPQAMGTFPFFIAWAVKSLVIRYGGLHLYRATLPLAVGLIVGDLLNTTLWNVAALATHGRF